MSVEVTYDVASDTWVAWDEQTLVSGFGGCDDCARTHYFDNCHDTYCKLLDLGQSKVSASLWKTLPALQATLGIV